MANAYPICSFDLDGSIPSILLSLAYAPRALSLPELVHDIDLPVENIAHGLDQLMFFQLISSDISYDRSELGKLVYTFADNVIARALRQSILQGD